MSAPKTNPIDIYLSNYPKNVQVILGKFRTMIRKAAPKAEEKISYGIPCFTLDGKAFIFCAGFKKHVSMYPAPVKEEAFRAAFSKYKTSTGTIQFQLDEPIPYPLVNKIIKYRLQVHKANMMAKKKAVPKKKAPAKKASSKK